MSAHRNLTIAESTELQKLKRLIKAGIVDTRQLQQKARDAISSVIAEATLLGANLARCREIAGEDGLARLLEGANATLQPAVKLSLSEASGLVDFPGMSVEHCLSELELIPRG